MSPDRSIVAVSDAFAQLLGYTVAELCGRTLESITYWPDASLDSEQYDQLLAGENDGYCIAKRCDHKQGTQVKLQLQLSTVRDASGKVAYAVMNVTPAAQTEETTSPAVDPELDEVEKIRRAMFW